MTLARRDCLAGIAGAALLAACASAPPPAPTLRARTALAPTGKLRVGVYAGSPASLVVDSAGNKAGVAYELGRELARWLDVPFEPVEHRSRAEVIDAMKAGEVDFTFTEASEARAQPLNFTLPMMHVELGGLAPAGSKLRSVSEMDRAGVKIGVMADDASLGVFDKAYKRASLVPVASLKAAADLLKQGRLDAFAASKDILDALARNAPGSRILDGRRGQESMAVAIPKGREAGLSYLSSFALSVRRDGTLNSAAARAGLRGAVEPMSR